MRVELECCGFNPILLQVVTEEKTKIVLEKNKIVIESSNEFIGRFTIKSRSIYNSKLCYLNIINPIFYLYQYKLKNDTIFFYDDNFIWMDIILNDTIDDNLKIKLEKITKRIENSTVCTYEITPDVSKKGLQIIDYYTPQKQIYRYKITNIASQLFYFILILTLMILQLVDNQENIISYLSALIILGFFSVIKIYKFYSAKSTKDI